VEKSRVENGFGGTAYIENECVKGLKSATSEGDEEEGQDEGKIFYIKS
jgi:hypothetical protein